MQTLLERVLLRGNAVSIRGGVLEVETASGKALPADWLSEHEKKMACEALRQLAVVGMMYSDYSTGMYQVSDRARSGGVTLQFINVRTGEDHPASFNAELTRARATRHGKKGTLLPKGQFRVRERHSFVKFWQRAGIPLPARLSAFSDCMGKLKGVIFEATCGEDGRLKTSSLKPINITHRQLLAAFVLPNPPDKPPTISRQNADNFPTRTPDKEKLAAQQPQEIPPNSTTWAEKCGSRLIGSTGKGKDIPTVFIPYSVALAHQSIEDWQAELGDEEAQ